MAFISKFRWLLSASLVLNAFLGGMLVGRWDRPKHFPPPNPADIADRMADGLPPADAAILRQAFASRAADLDQGHHAMEAVHRQIDDLLEAPTFDSQAMKRVLEGIRQAHEAEDNAMSGALMEAATRISPEARRRLAHFRQGPPSRP